MTRNTILLADDDDAFVRSTAALLAAHNYVALTARDATAALEQLQRKRPDLMVVNIELAVRTPQFECNRRVPACKELRSTPVLTVADGHKGMFDLDPAGTWLPVARTMHKPIDPTAFLAAIAALLRRRGEMDWEHGSGRHVRDILSDKQSDVWTIGPQASVLDAVEMMETRRIGCLPVTEAGRLVGIFTERDCMRRVLLPDRPSRTTRVREVMTSPVICVSLDDTIEECMSLMTHKRVRHLPVMQHGELIGIVSIGDLVRAALAQQTFMIDQLERYITAG